MSPLNYMLEKDEISENLTQKEYNVRSYHKTSLYKNHKTLI